MLSRREFLRRSSFLAAGATLLPSQVWPHRKIFVPAEPKIYSPPHLYQGFGMDMQMEWNDGLWTISGDSIEKLYREMLIEIRKQRRI